MIDNNNIPVGYKDTPVGIIPEEWEVYDLKEFAFLSKEKYEPSPLSLLHCVELEHLSQGDGILLGRTQVSLQKSTKNVFKKGDILFGKLRPYLRKYWMADFNGVCSSEIWVLKTNNKICINEFLFRLVSSNRFIQRANVSIGSKMPRADWNFVSISPFALPPIAEQKKIAEILCTWDDAIEKQSKLIEKLEFRKRGLMQRLLTGKTRLSGFTEPWKKIELGEIGSTYTGLSGKTKSDFENGNAKFISYVNVFSNEKVNINDFGTVKINSNEKQNIVRYGDIFFTVSSETPNEVGMSSVLLDAVENTYLNSFCFGYRLNDFSVLEPVFASYILRTDKFRSSIILLAQGSTRFNLSKNEVMKLQIELPSFSEQQAIAEVLTSAEREIKNHRKKIEAMRQQKRGLMQQLLTGKTRVKI